MKMHLTKPLNDNSIDWPGTDLGIVYRLKCEVLTIVRLCVVWTKIRLVRNNRLSILFTLDSFCLYFAFFSLKRFKGQVWRAIYARHVYHWGRKFDTITCGTSLTMTFSIEMPSLYSFSFTLPFYPLVIWEYGGDDAVIESKQYFSSHVFSPFCDVMPLKEQQ